MVRWAEIHLNRLLHNYSKVKRLLNRKGMYAVVKANAYGHGSTEVSRFLEENTDVSGFAVATFNEAESLRNAGIKREVLVISTPIEMGRKQALELNLTPVISDFDSLELVKQLDIPFHIKIDTGMGRLGFLKKDWEKLFEELKDSKVSGIMSHFSSADEDESFTREQFKVFSLFAKALKSLKPDLKVHIDNSAAISFGFNDLLTHSRVGIALYGIKPFESYPANLEQVMDVKSKVISVKDFPPNYPISYSGTYRTTSNERLAVVAFGYADGLSRQLSNRGEILINGERHRIRGRICMDMTVVSVNSNVRKGDTAVISSNDVPFSEIANISSTIPYEVMCSISPRVKRIYID